MPELPEVETVVRGIRPRVVGRRIGSVVLASPLMAVSRLGPWDRELPGRVLERLDRQGKWMFFRVGGGDTLVVHLGMTGNLGVTAAEAPPLPHTHLRLTLDDGREELRLADPRRFGELLLYGPEHFEERFGSGKLGPDALEITRRRLAEGLARTRRTIKSALLDQKLLAGIGNIYADESLFAAGIAPGRLANEVAADTEAVRRLYRAMRRVLRRSIEAEGTTIRDYVNAHGVPGEFQKRLKVYGRGDQPCGRCRGTILLDREILPGRATHWCPGCQAV